MCFLKSVSITSALESYFLPHLVTGNFEAPPAHKQQNCMIGESICYVCRLRKLCDMTVIIFSGNVCDVAEYDCLSDFAE